MVKRSQGASAESWTYGYDHRGQQLWAENRATDGGTLVARVEYAYDAFGTRTTASPDCSGPLSGSKVSNSRMSHAGSRRDRGET
jgi:hypothetical protein